MIFSRPRMRILMVCTANVCRSPMAEALLRQELRRLGLHRKVKVDSAGTHAAQPGRTVDPRAQTVCSRSGIDLSKLRARQIRPADFERFDLILAMDARNLDWLLSNCPEGFGKKITMITSWLSKGDAAEVPDPYYGAIDGFERVFELLQASTCSVAARLDEQLES